MFFCLRICDSGENERRRLETTHYPSSTTWPLPRSNASRRGFPVPNSTHQPPTNPPPWPLPRWNSSRRGFQHPMLPINHPQAWPLPRSNASRRGSQGLPNDGNVVWTLGVFFSAQRSTTTKGYTTNSNHRPLPPPPRTTTNETRASGMPFIILIYIIY
jgi:hypothetical protein